MKNYFKIVNLIFFVFLHVALISQNANNQWRFGNLAGLDFNTSPPSVVTNNAMNSYYYCSSISDNNGNLLFYTNGGTVWTQNNVIMANGTGLYGGLSAGGSQGTMIIKKPGSSTIYYIFSCDYSPTGPNNGFFYTEVDMSLAAGQGSVTIKNVQLNTGTCSKITATRHCNGVDIWVVERDYTYNPNPSTQSTSGSTALVSCNNSFRAFLITAAGVNPSPVISTPLIYTYGVGSWGYDFGNIRISPNGRKLGVVMYTYVANYTINQTNNNTNGFEMYDFDNTTGVVSNPLILAYNVQHTNSVGGPAYNYPYGCEFSPDGSKFYGARLNTGINAGVFQWDLCSGSPQAVVASMSTVYVGTGASFGSMMLGPDGKIYVARSGGSTLDAITNPNAAGVACNYVAGAQSIAPNLSTYSLPNLVAQNPRPVPFTHTVNIAYGCQTASFNTMYTPGMTSAPCLAYTLTSLDWNFGDPASGAANVSTLLSPDHHYTSVGTYTASLYLHYTCGGGTDTIRQVINVTTNCLSVSSSFISCAALGTATVSGINGVGPYTYNWLPGGQTTSVVTGMSPGVYTVTVYDVGANQTSFTTSTFTPNPPLTGTVASNNLLCNGVANATAAISVSNGSGNQFYNWSNGVTTQNTAIASALNAGTWSVTVIDALTSCVLTKTFTVTQPPVLTVTAAAVSATTCAGTIATMYGGASGGVPAYTYSWIAGSSTATNTISQPLPGNYIYTLQVTDQNNCAVSALVGITFVNNPTLTVNSMSICPLQTATLSVNGASTYTWNTNLSGNTLTNNPLSTTLYTVTGQALGCTSTATAAIVLKTAPVPTVTSNSPVCNDQVLQLSALGGTTYEWNGPQFFYSVIQNPTLTVAPLNSGVYSATLTSANGCTASANVNVTVNPTPTLALTGSTVCVTQALNLQASSFINSTFVWTGPNSFASTMQNPVITNASVPASGNYTVTVTSAQNCTNSDVINASVVALPVISYTTNSPVCVGSQLLLHAFSNVPVSYSWHGPGTFVSSIQSPAILNTGMAAAGVYTLTGSIGPCVATYTAAPVVVNPLPSVAILNSGAACEGKSIQLSVTGNGTVYTWAGPSFASTGIMVTFNPVNISNDGTYTVTATDINGCKSSANTSVSVLVNPVISAHGTVVCIHQAATLTATGASTYLWEGPAGYTATLSHAVIPVTGPAAVGVYTVTGKAVNNCTTVATVNVDIHALPQPSLIVTPTACINSPIRLQGFGGQSYTWEGPANFSAASQDVSFSPFSMSSGGIYTLTVADMFGCKNYTTAFVTVFDLPQSNLWSSHQARCAPFCSEFKLSPINLSPGITAKWEIGGQTFGDSLFRYCFDKPGLYPLKGTFTDAYCTNITVFPIQVHAIPVADFNFVPENPTENIDNVLFTSTALGENLSTWNWEIKDNVKNHFAASENTSYFFGDAGTYPVAMVVSNKAGCSDTIIKLVTVQPDFNVYVPNAFTPNEDGRNDLFMPTSRNIATFTFSVFDRWGAKVFTTTNPASGWDGTYKGEPCKQDVYVWKLSVKSNDGKNKEMAGYVNLYR